MLWYVLVSRVGALHRDNNLIAPFPLGQKCPRKITINYEPPKTAFKNYCLTHPGKFSCPVGYFPKLNYAVFKDFIRHMKRNDFFLVVLEPGLFLVRKFICFRIFCITFQKLIWQPFKNQWRDHFQKATLQDIC